MCQLFLQKRSVDQLTVGDIFSHRMITGCGYTTRMVQASGKDFLQKFERHFPAGDASKIDS